MEPRGKRRNGRGSEDVGCRKFEGNVNDGWRDVVVAAKTLRGYGYAKRRRTRTWTFCAAVRKALSIMRPHCSWRRMNWRSRTPSRNPGPDKVDKTNSLVSRRRQRAEFTIDYMSNDTHWNRKSVLLLLFIRNGLSFSRRSRFVCLARFLFYYILS